MNATATTSRQSRATAAERFEDISPVIAGPVYGPSALVLLGPWLLLVLLLVPPAAFLLTILVAVALPFVAVALAAAVVASPFLLARAVHRHFAERRSSRTRSAPIVARVAPPRRAARQPGLSS